jgi:hypothetical protein
MASPLNPHTSDFPMDGSEAFEALQRWTAISALALILATYPLWTPQQIFPQVPAFASLCKSPAWWDWICLSVLIVGLLLSALPYPSGRRRLRSFLVLVALTALVCIDQHRFQPWAYQLWLFAAIGLGCDCKRLILVRWLVVSIYFHSAVGKFDFEFLHSVGQQMLGAMLKFIGQDVSALPDWLRLVLVLTFPVTELAIAVGLAFPKTRRIAGVLAMGLHLMLILTLGPLGLNHRAGVLLWNVQFAVQAYLLFVTEWNSASNEIVSEQNSAPRKFSQVESCLQASCVLLVAAAIAMPLTERFGIWDHWPSWALYAPHSSRVRVEVAGEELHRLPRELVALTNRRPSETDDGPDWVLIPIELWSLQSLNTPIYPQSRFQLGVARHLAVVLDSDTAIRVTLLGSADRFTGVRKSEAIYGRTELTNSGQIFWLNSCPREQNDGFRPQESR